MLVIVGMILLLTWIFERAFHLTADSLVLLLIFASISFALDFIREQEIMEPRTGWDHRPRRLHVGSVARWIGRRLEGPSAPLPAPAEKSAADRKGNA
jgi:hypothetical protein